MAKINTVCTDVLLHLPQSSEINKMVLCRIHVPRISYILVTTVTAESFNRLHQHLELQSHRIATRLRSI